MKRTKEQLWIDPEANRQVDLNYVARLQANWSPTLVGVLTVAQGGAIIDGQHRWHAAPAGFEFEVGVVDAHNTHARARAFLVAHDTKAVSAMDKHKVGKAAGKWLDLQAAEAAEHMGIKIELSNARRCIRGVTAWKAIVKRYGAEGAINVLGIVEDAWHFESAAAYNRNILTAVARFLDYPNVDPQRLVDTLAKNQPESWLTLSESQHGHGYGQVHDGVKALYNRGLRGKKRLA